MYPRDLCYIKRIPNMDLSAEMDSIIWCLEQEQAVRRAWMLTYDRKVKTKTSTFMYNSFPLIGFIANIILFSKIIHFQSYIYIHSNFQSILVEFQREQHLHQKNYNIIKKKVKTREYSQLMRSGLKLNQQFRKQIRRRDIDHRFSERRKQLLQDLKCSKNSVNNMENNGGQINTIVQQKNQDTQQMIEELESIYYEYQINNHKINEHKLKKLAIISCNITGAKIILEIQANFIHQLLNQFINKEDKDHSQSQKFVLVTFSNCLTIADIANKTQNDVKYANFNALATSECLLLKLFTISLQSNIDQSREYALSCIFSIIYNNDERFAHQMVLNPTYNLMGLLFNHMHTAPKRQQIVEVFRIFYITMKKLKFCNIEQFGKMRKFIINVIKNSTSKEIIRISIVCLHAFLKCLPHEKVIISKSGILQQIFSQTLVLNNAKIATYSLRIATILLEQLNESETKLIVSFIQKVLIQFNHDQANILALKMLHSILCNTPYNCNELLSNHLKLIIKIMQLFESNLTNREILTQISNILPIIVIKNKNTIDKNLYIRIRERLEEILETGMFNQVSNHFLEQSLQVFGNTNEIELL